MAEASKGRIDLVRQALRLLTRDEVKTPLAFFFKFPYATALAVVGIVWAPGSAAFKLTAIGILVVFFGAVLSMVALICWHRPKNLVYGETGHRAETKLEMGTETRALSPSAVGDTPGEPAPVQIGEGS